jgi:hypothetical protein
MPTKKERSAILERLLNDVQRLHIHGALSDSEAKRAFGRVAKLANKEGYAVVRRGFRDYRVERLDAVP